MNARQKAKKYKDKAEAFKEIVRRYGTIETLKVVKYWDDRVPEEFLKGELARDIAECLLREGYIDFKVNDNYNEYNMKRRVIATIKVTKVGNIDEKK